MNRLCRLAAFLCFTFALENAQQACQAEDLLPGRLFHSAAERAALDGRRPQRSLVISPAQAGRSRVRPISPERSPELSGFVLRSDGRNSYWLAAPMDQGLRH